jgi:hypothetical protein
MNNSLSLLAGKPAPETMLVLNAIVAEARQIVDRSLASSAAGIGAAKGER